MRKKFDYERYLSVTPEHREAQFARLLELVALHNEPERAAKLLSFYSDFEDRVKNAPASGKIFYHCAYPGGYLDHVLRVIDTAVKFVRFYKHVGGDADFTEQEVIFAAMHHDLGKLGTPDQSFYEVEPDMYWIEQGYTYKVREEEVRMDTYDRTIQLLNSYGIRFTPKEMVGMRMANGCFDEGARMYFNAPGPFSPLGCNIGYIVHWADWMCTRAESDQQRLALCD
jgi:hypothetical protein